MAAESGFDENYVKEAGEYTPGGFLASAFTNRSFGPTNEDLLWKLQYRIIRELAEKKIGIEMCPISNLQTKAVSGPEFYPIREFLDHGVRVTVNTDNRTVSNTTMTKELEFIQKTYGVRDEEVLLLMRNAVDAAFASDTVKEKLYRKLAEK